MNTRENDRTNKLTAMQMSCCAIFTALTVAGAFIKIPVPVVPFTLQILFVYLAGSIIGAKLGALSMIIYMLLGLIGVPVFAEGGGIWYILKPSFGYIIGFIIATYVIGKLTEKFGYNSYIKLVLAYFIGLMMDYAVGMIYYYVICNYVINTPIALWPLILYCFIMVVPGDIVLCFIAAYITKRIKPVITNMNII